MPSWVLLGHPMDSVKPLILCQDGWSLTLRDPVIFYHHPTAVVEAEFHLASKSWAEIAIVEV